MHQAGRDGRMAKPLQPRAPVALHALAYIALSLQLPLNLADGWDIVFSGLLFAPLLAAWLGARFGRRGLAPLWISAPLTLPDWTLGFGYTFVFQLGFGAALFALCVLVTLVFAAKRDAGGQAAAAPAPVWMGVSAAVLAVAAGYAEAGLSLAESRVSIGIDAPWAMALAAFALVVLRRCPSGLAAVAVIVAAAAGYALNRAVDLYWSIDGGTYALAWDVSAGWGMRALEAGSFGLAAILAGKIVRNWQGLGAAGRMLRRAAAGLTVLLILPPALTAAEAALQRAASERPLAEAGLTGAAGFPVAAAARAMAPPVLLQGVEQIIVTASRRRPPSAQIALGHPAAGHLLAVFSLVLGAALANRAAFWLPQAVLGATVVSALAVERAIYGPGFFADYYFAEDFFVENVSAVLWAAFACWTFVWLGMRARLRAHERGGGVT